MGDDLRNRLYDLQRGVGLALKTLNERDFEELERLLLQMSSIVDRAIDRLDSDLEQAVGRFFLAFAELESALGEAVKVVLKAKEPSDVVVAALGDFAHKVAILKIAVAQATDQDGQPLSGDWLRNAENTIDRCLAINNGFRVPFQLGAMRIGSKELLVLQVLTITDGAFRTSSISWTPRRLEQQAKRVAVICQHLRELTRELTTCRIGAEPALYLVQGLPVGNCKVDGAV